MFNNIIQGNSGPWGKDLALIANTYITYLYYNNIDTDSILNNDYWEGTGNIVDDPELYTDLIHLVYSSPCIDAGTDEVEVAGITYEAPGLDIDGEERPFSTDCDIGADEWFDYSLGVDNILAANQQFIRIYPNPVAGHANIEFEVRNAGRVKVSIHDINGRYVASAVSGHFEKGTYRVQLDAGPFKGGIYICRLKTPGRTLTSKMIVIE